MGMQIHNPFRRRPVAATAAAMSATALALIILLLEHPAIYPLSSQPSPWRSVFGSHSAGVTNWTFMLKNSESAYLILIMATVLLLPLLELLGHLHQPAVKLANTPISPVNISAPDMANVSLKHGQASAAATADASPALITKVASLTRSYLSLVWPFSRLSITAAVFLSSFVVFMLLTIVVPLATLSVEDLKAPMFMSSYLEVNPDYVLPNSLAWTYAFGAESAWPTLYTYAIALLPVSRTTPVLACIGLSYEETIAFHKFAGSLATFWACVHGVFSTFPLLSFGWDWYATAAWSPSYASGHMYEFAGQMAVLTQLVMVFFAAQYFRTRHYKLFRATHCLYPLVFFSAVTHRFTCFWYFLLGMTLIMSDVGQRLTNKMYASTAELVPTGDSERTVVLRVRSPFPKGASAIASLPGRFFYVQVPNVSSLEWHPMSITDADADGNLTFVIKVFGAWTTGLHVLASTKADASWAVRLEGPYGYDWAEPACERLLMGGANNAVAFVAGGVGISPFASVIATLIERAPQALLSLKVLWSVRDVSVLQMYAPLLRHASALGARVQVHVTGAARAFLFGSDNEETKALEPDPHMQAVASASTGSPVRRPAHGSAGAAIATMSSTITEGRQMPWSPASPYYAWFSGMIILYLACAGSVLGFLLSRQVFYTYSDMHYEFPASANATYVDMVLANYAALNGGASPPGGWPEDQMPLADVHPYTVLVFGQETEMVISCKEVPGLTKHLGYPYGLPLPCRTVAQAFTWPAFTACLLAWGGALLFAALAGLAFKRLRTSALSTERHPATSDTAKAARAAALVSECGTADRAQLYAAKLHGDDGGAAACALAVAAGRPEVSAFLAAAAGDAASGTGAGAAAAVDCYVCGSASLLSDARESFYKIVTPACRGSAFLGLRYSIG